MRGAIFTNSDGIVGEDVRDAVEFRKSSHANGGSEVVDEHKEGGSRDFEKSMVRESVHDGSHGVLADTKVQVSASVRFVETGTEVTSIVDVVRGGSVEIGRSRDVVRDELGNFLNDFVLRNTGGFRSRLHFGDFLQHICRRHGLVGNGITQLAGEFGVGLLPRRIGFLPGIVLGLVCLLDF